MDGGENPAGETDLLLSFRKAGEVGYRAVETLYQYFPGPRDFPTQSSAAEQTSDALRNQLDCVKQMISESRGDQFLYQRLPNGSSSPPGRTSRGRRATESSDRCAGHDVPEVGPNQEASHVDWIVLSHYIQIGCEEPSAITLEPRLYAPDKTLGAGTAPRSSLPFRDVHALREKPKAE